MLLLDNKSNRLLLEERRSVVHFSSHCVVAVGHSSERGKPQIPYVYFYIISHTMQVGHNNYPYTIAEGDLQASDEYRPTCQWFLLGWLMLFGSCLPQASQLRTCKLVLKWNGNSEAKLLLPGAGLISCVTFTFHCPEPLRLPHRCSASPRLCVMLPHAPD
jgi:hypothetical protein